MLLCALLVLGGLFSACTSRRVPSPPARSATSAGAVLRSAPGGETTVTPGSTSTVAPVPVPTPLSTAASDPPPAVSGTTATETPVAPTSDGTATVDGTGARLSADELAARVDALVNAAPAHVAVEIGLADGTTLYEHNAEDLFDAASLYKLGIMVQVYKDRDNGTLTFDDPVTLAPGFFYESDEVYSADTDVGDEVPVGELLHNMITLSSNVAAEALLYLVGTDAVNQTMADLGLENTKILWSPVAGRSPAHHAPLAVLDSPRARRFVRLSARSTPPASRFSAVSSAEGAYDLTTAADMASLFQQLLAGTVLSPDTSAEMLDLLASQQINNRLPAELPAATRVAHKTGDLDGLMHDAGVIYAPSGPIVVVIMTDQITDYNAILDLFHQVAALAYQFAP